MTVLRLDPLAGVGLDRAVAVLETATLVRRPDGRYADVPVADVARFVRALAFGGIAATACDADLAGPPGTIPAVGRDLDPLPEGLVAADLVRLRRLGLGESAAEVLRRRAFGLRAPPASARERCRALLRGEEVPFAWARRAWGTRAALRSRAARSSLRPLVFDRAAAEPSDLSGRAFARDGSLSRWLFG